MTSKSDPILNAEQVRELAERKRQPDMNEVVILAQDYLRLREERKQYKAGLQRLASKEAFTGAFDVHYADTAILWAEMQARGRFAEDVLSKPILAKTDCLRYRHKDVPTERRSAE